MTETFSDCGFVAAKNMPLRRHTPLPAPAIMLILKLLPIACLSREAPEPPAIACAFSLSISLSLSLSEPPSRLMELEVFVVKRSGYSVDFKAAP